MNIQEFSNQFDVLLNSGSGNGYPPVLKLDEYEKSVYLTNAQEELVKNLYSGRTIGLSFEQTEELREYLNTLVKSKVYTTSDEQTDLAELSAYHVNTFYKLPEDLWFITLDQATLSSDDKCLDNKQIEVIPALQNEFHRIQRNPFRGPSDSRALRFGNFNGYVQLMSSEAIKTYTIWYLSKPTPIILTDLSHDNLDIEGYNKPMECMLDELIHRPILELAVRNALAMKVSQNSSNDKNKK